MEMLRLEFDFLLKGVECSDKVSGSDKDDSDQITIG